MEQLPVINNVSEAYTNNGQYSVLYFTIPRDKFKPMVKSFSDLLSDENGKTYLYILCIMFDLVSNYFYSESCNLTDEHGNPRFKVYMEYILPDDGTIVDNTVLDISGILGIRFRFYLYDQDIKIDHAFKKQIENHDKYIKSLLKRKSKVSNLPRQGKYILIHTMRQWLKLVSVYLKRWNDNDSIYEHECLDRETLEPKPSSALSFDNIFDWDPSLIIGMNQAQRNRERANQFVFPRYTFELYADMLHPKILFDYRLPLSLRWVDQTDEQMLKIKRALVERTIYTEPLINGMEVFSESSLNDFRK